MSSVGVPRDIFVRRLDSYFQASAAIHEHVIQVSGKAVVRTGFDRYPNTLHLGALRVGHSLEILFLREKNHKIFIEKRSFYCIEMKTTTHYCMSRKKRIKNQTSLTLAEVCPDKASWRFLMK